MTFRQKLLAYSSIASVIAAIPNGVSAQMVSLDYHEVPLSDPVARQMWKDEISDAKPLGQYSPWAVIAKVKLPNKQEFYVGQLWSGSHCSVKDCPVKVMQGNEILLDVMGCDNTDEHALNESGNTLFLCEMAYPTNAK